jgi:ATP-binding protein involved in chromosome partitioning
MQSAAVLEDLELVRERIREKLEGVGQVLAVMSGKGGVGKSALAVHLALGFSRHAATGLLDADLQSPSTARMLGLRGQPLRMRGDSLLPVRGPAGVLVQGMDFFLQGSQPLDWEGTAQEGAALRSLLEDAALADLLGRTEWGELGSLVIDLPPGSDRLPALARLVPRSLCTVVVTLPTEVSLLAVERSIRRAVESRVPIVGLVENMGSVVCPHCGVESKLFQEASVDAKASEMGVELIARIPFDPLFAAAADAGSPLPAADEEPTPAARAVRDLADTLQRRFEEVPCRVEA